MRRPDAPRAKRAEKRRPVAPRSRLAPPPRAAPAGRDVRETVSSESAPSNGAGSWRVGWGGGRSRRRRFPDRGSLSGWLCYWRRARRGRQTAQPAGAGAPGAATAQPAGAGPLGLGRAATAEEIAALDIDIRPDGAGLPLGGGTVADGARVWDRACRACHGAEGEGGIAAPVVGRDPAARPPTVGNYWPYATTLYDYIYRAMPGNTPGTLTPDEVYGLVAWILNRNDIIDDGAVMNAATLPDVVMPARDRFVPDDRLESDAVR